MQRRHLHELHEMQMLHLVLQETQLRERHALEVVQFRSREARERQALGQHARREREQNARRRRVEGSVAFHGSAAFRRRQSALFVPFICAVLGVPHPGIDGVRAAFEAVEAGLWQRQVQAYVAHFARQNLTANTVAWEPGRQPHGLMSPYMNAVEQQRLLEPDRHVRDSQRLHVTERIYANFVRVVPHFQPPPP